MADFNSSLPVRTENAGDVIAKISDATITSQQLKVNADGSIDTNVSATDLDIRDLSHTQDSVKVGDGTDFLAVNADGSINITDNGGSLTVDATDLDIRDLDSAQDSVEVLQATHDNLNLNANLQVGDADVANGNPVPVSDAGGSLTVDATDLDIRDLSHTQDSVKIGDGTDFLAVNADGSINSVVTATDLDIRDLDAAQDNIAISDGTDTLEINADGSLNAVVTATDLDIRDLSHSQDSVKIGDGTDFLAVNTDGSINVVVSNDVQGTEVCSYQTSAAVAGGASVNFDYTVTAATTLIIDQAWASGSGKIKVELKVETSAGSGTYNTKFVGFNSTSNPNIEISVSRYLKQVAGAKVRITITNRDNQAQDVYATLTGSES